MNPEQTMNIEISDKEWEGIYSNFAIITHSNSEFIIDFARALPGAKKAKVFSRIIMTPQHARALLATLEQNIKKFEGQFGQIPFAPQDLNRGPIGFQTDSEESSKKKP
jgi:hypothetical protein